MAALPTIHDVTGRRLVGSIYLSDIYGGGTIVPVPNVIMLPICLYLQPKKPVRTWTESFSSWWRCWTSNMWLFARLRNLALEGPGPCSVLCLVDYRYVGISAHVANRPLRNDIWTYKSGAIFKMSSNPIPYLLSRVVDPDPHPDPDSMFLWIRIRIGNPDPEARKWRKVSTFLFIFFIFITERYEV
jgi:hypothetical protein